jgi:hypothetical protein
LNVLVVHDFDDPLYTRRTCLRRAFWLVVYALFGWSQRVRNKMPKWLLYEKYSQAKALALLDKMLGVNAVFAFRKEINETFPTLKDEIEKLGFQVVNHWHLKEPRKGYNEWKARGAWDKIVDHTKTYLNYDRHYVMFGEKVMPDEGTNVIWHVDHMPYNLFYYLEFLNLMKEKDKQKSRPQ